MFKCERCNGSGYTSFDHIEGGVCFACRGSGKVATQRPARTFAPIVVTQSDVRTSLAELYKVVRGFAQGDRGAQISFSVPGVPSRAAMIAARLQAAHGDLRVNAEEAFQQLLGADWHLVQRHFA